MIKEIQYTSINRVLDNLMEHPLLRDLTIEQVIRYTIRFIGLHGYPKLYTEKSEDVKIDSFKGLLPCDLESIIQVEDKKSGICLRSMTDTKVFNDNESISHDACGRPCKDKKELYIPRRKHEHEELSFKTQGRIIYTSFPKGEVTIYYRAVPVDENGYPMLIDNENYLAALEAFIKVQIFTIKFDTGKINANVLQNAQQEYAWRAAELQDEFTVPSMSEMESLTRMYNTMLLSTRQFDKRFKHLGDREYIRRH